MSEKSKVSWNTSSVLGTSNSGSSPETERKRLLPSFRVTTLGEWIAVYSLSSLSVSRFSPEDF